MVLKRRRPSGFITPCQPTRVTRPPSGHRIIAQCAISITTSQAAIINLFQVIKREGDGCHDMPLRTTRALPHLRILRRLP
jgi:hypothetical protein